MRKIAFGLLNGSPEPSPHEITTRGDSVMQGLEMAGFLAPDANATAVRLVGEFLVRFFSDQAAGRATQDVSEQVDYELRSLLGSGAIAFPSAFTFVARAFTSVDGIAKSLRPEYELREAVEPFVGKLISDEYSSQAKEKRDALRKPRRGCRAEKLGRMVCRREMPRCWQQGWWRAWRSRKFSRRLGSSGTIQFRRRGRLRCWTGWTALGKLRGD